MDGTPPGGTRYGSGDDLVSRLLGRSREVAARTADLASRFSRERSSTRSALLAEGMIHAVPGSLLDGVALPGVCAVDGGMVCDSRAVGDICAAVGVSVGPGDEIRNEVWMEGVSRSARNNEILTGVMSGMEIRLAASSRADLVMIDGSLLSALINISKAVNHSHGRASALEEAAFGMKSAEMRDAVMEVLTSKRFVALPKYTTTAREFEGRLPPSLVAFDGRTVATLALRAGEMMALFRSDEQRQEDYEVAKRRVGNALGFSETEYGEFVKAATSVVYSYYRPHEWTPAFRFDVPYTLHGDREAGRRVLRAIRDTTTAPGMREPLPLFLADRFAKQVSVGVAPVTDMAAAEFDEDDDALLLMIMGYRT